MPGKLVIQKSSVRHFDSAWQFMSKESLFLYCSTSFLLIVLSCGEEADSARHYRIHQDRESLYRTLYEQIREGDTRPKVESLLGKGKEFSTWFEGQSHDIQLEQARMEVVREFDIEDPDYDNILYWVISDGDTLTTSFVKLFFRNDVLVYFRHDDYKDADDPWLPQERVNELIEQLPDSIRNRL